MKGVRDSTVGKTVLPVEISQWSKIESYVVLSYGIILEIVYP